MRMNITSFFLLVSLLQVGASSLAQKVTLRGKDVSLEKVFREIRKQTGYDVLVNNTVFKTSAKIDVNFVETPLEKVMDRVVAGSGLTYVIEDRTVLIKEKSMVDKVIAYFSNIDVSGRVVDEKGEGIAGASVKVKGTGVSTVADEQGRFVLRGVVEDAVLEISVIGYMSREVKVAKELGSIRLEVSVGNLEEVSVVNTGYQTLKPNEITGSVVKLNNELINRRVGSTILDRIRDMAPGLSYIENSPSKRTTNERSGFAIRGRSTIDNAVSADPLIILDNFPYEGDIANINPNSIESITILKDAAAASIWGSRSGNGVIVLTSKKGKINQKTAIDFNSNATVATRPDLNYQQLLNSNQYIEIERNLFNKGYFDSDFTSGDPSLPSSTFPVISPAVEILNLVKSNAITAAEGEARLAQLSGNEVRNDYRKYLYQNQVSQQHALNVRGGSEKVTYSLSMSFDGNRSNFVGNRNNRTALNSLTTLYPFKNLEVNIGLIYSKSNMENNSIANSLNIGGKYTNFFPYARLADDQGNPQSVVKNYRDAFADTTFKRGYLDWKYKPLNELGSSDITSQTNHMIARAGVKYKLLPFLDAEISYQNEEQRIQGKNFQSLDSYFTRDLINQYSVRSSTGVFTYNIPKNGIMDLTDSKLNSQNGRAMLHLNKTISYLHEITAIVGAEIRESKLTSYGRRSYGFDNSIGVGVTNINYATSFPRYPSGTGVIPMPSQNASIAESTDRFISYYTNITYTFNKRYTLSLSGRQDGANIFGVKTNDKFNPFYSIGGAWDISSEKFYDIKWLNNLRARASYGFNGNVYNSAAYLLARFGVPLLSLTGDIAGTITSAPNSELSWESVKNINVGLDYGLFGGRINGTVELYRKDGLDLIQDVLVAPQTGFASFKGNSASTRTYGIDFSLAASAVQSRNFKWNVAVIFNGLSEKVVDFDPKYTSSQFTTRSTSVLYPSIGRPLFSVYSLKWAGLDPANGDPQGYDQNMVVSKDYSSLTNNTKIENLQYHGSSRPTRFGALMNIFSYGPMSFSISVVYKLGYYFRRNGVALNYADLLRNDVGSGEFSQAWKLPGDESSTNVPSIVYPSNLARNNFYSASEILVEKGDHIRLQDIRLSYDLKSTRSKLFRDAQIYSYMNNLGVIWKANDKGIDPDFGDTGLPNPISAAIGVKFGFK